MDERIIFHIFDNWGQTNDSIHLHDLLVVRKSCQKAKVRDIDILYNEFVVSVGVNPSVFESMSKIHVSSFEWLLWFLRHPEQLIHVVEILLCEYNSNLKRQYARNPYVGIDIS
jgi:hypothetical protein